MTGKPLSRIVGCRKEFMQEQKFGMNDGQGFSPRVRMTCGLGVVGEEDLCPECVKNAKGVQNE